MKTILSYLNEDFRLLVYVMTGIIIFFFIGIKMESQWFPKPPRTFLGDPGITIDIKVIAPQIEKPGQTTIG